MNKELIDKLQIQAAEIGYWIGRNRLGQDWANYNGDSRAFNFEILGPGKIRFLPHGHYASITFSNIRPRKIRDSHYHPPILRNTVIGDLNSSVITNASDNITLEREYTFNEDETTSMSQEAGVEVGISIRQQIGYGGVASPVSGETEISLSVTAHYNKTWGTETSKGREISNSIEVPPRTEATISIQKSTSDFEQKAEYWCELDYDVNIWSHNDYDIKIEGLDEMRAILDGVGVWNHPLTKTFKDGRVNQEVYDKLLRQTDIKLEQTLKFSNASTGNVKITERKL